MISHNDSHSCLSSSDTSLNNTDEEYDREKNNQSDCPSRKLLFFACTIIGVTVIGTALIVIGAIKSVASVNVIVSIDACTSIADTWQG